jgi:LysR family transcriptional regulator, transcriptional activator of the cysJI operon
MLSFDKSVALISKRLIELHDSSLERRIFFVNHRDLWIGELFRHFQMLVKGTGVGSGANVKKASFPLW